MPSRHCLLFWLPLLSLFCFTSAAAGDASSRVEPVIDTNFPDPCLAQDQLGTWYAFSTQNEGINTQVASSIDFANWKLHDGYDALPILPAWTLAHPTAGVWAPDVNRLPSGEGWVMYFAARHRSSPKKHCIGAAMAANVSGPYVPLEHPLICDLERGGNIDPNLFNDPNNGFHYLVYKVDGNSIGNGGACGNTVAPVASTPIYLQQVSSIDLVTLIDEPVYLINNLEYGSFKYDGANTERPSIAYRNNTYYLLYNAHCYAELTYRIDYISCINGVDTKTGIAGCQWARLKAAQQAQKERILLQTHSEVSKTHLYAPGSMDTSDDSRKMVFHGDTNLDWFARKPGAKVKRTRAMYAGNIEYEGKDGDLRVLGLIQSP